MALQMDFERLDESSNGLQIGIRLSNLHSSLKLRSLDRFRDLEPDGTETVDEPFVHRLLLSAG